MIPEIGKKCYKYFFLIENVVRKALIFYTLKFKPMSFHKIKQVQILIKWMNTSNNTTYYFNLRIQTIRYK